MEQTFIHLAETAAWFLAITCVFAVIGVIATIRWIVGLFWKTEQAVEGGISSIERKL